MKPMLPTLTFHPPQTGSWLYEIKYDGYRAILEWTKDELHLWSRNKKDLLPQFPEVRAFFNQYKDKMSKFLPLVLDGELVLLENAYKANFQMLQKRGRMRSEEKIALEANRWPCHFLVFDALAIGGNCLTSEPYIVRKQKLLNLIQHCRFPTSPSPANGCICQFVPFDHSIETVSKIAEEYNSEGIIAKQSHSEWKEGKRTSAWLKMKNWKTVSCFITGMDEGNNYFSVGVWKEDKIFPIGQFLFNLDAETKAALRTTIQQNYTERQGSFLAVAPGICLDLYYLEWADEQLREPHFKALRFDLPPDECTYEKFQEDEALFPSDIKMTHPEKVLWEKNHVTKLEYVRYLRVMAHFMLPFLQNRALTVIRCPHGIFGESFYQKNKPDSSPDFIHSCKMDGIDYIVCNDLKTLIWLGNQLAIEFHVPFQTVHEPYVSEIVFDLDPPSRTEFQSAVYGARVLKKVLDEFQLFSFVKLSGNKGLQVYIPLPEGVYTWEDTRLFTSFAAEFLMNYDPSAFTIERLKKNRGGKLYVDFIQHAEGKTIIAPYSVRNNEDGLVAAPIEWHELTDSLSPDQFTIQTVTARMKQMSDPFVSYFHCKDKQPFEKVLSLLKK